MQTCMCYIPDNYWTSWTSDLGNAMPHIILLKTKTNMGSMGLVNRLVTGRLTRTTVSRILYVKADITSDD